MKITVLQHSKDTPPGMVQDYFEQRGLDYQILRLDQGAKLPDLANTDWIVILGGAMNADQEDKHPWLADEKAFLKKAVAAGKTCLGLCLGGQLLSQVLGGQVKKHTHWEVGFHKVKLNGGELDVFQWHQDTFSLPPGAERIATNAITENQGFTFRDHVVGFQFHPEAKEDWVRQCAKDKDYPSGAHVQSPEQLVNAVAKLKPTQQWFLKLLEELEQRTRQKLTSDRVGA